MGKIIKLRSNATYSDNRDHPNWQLNSKSIVRYMKMAANFMDLPDMNRPCLSRQIGCIIVDPSTDSVISAGHNGPPDGLPRCDDPEYLKNVVWPMLTDFEKFGASCDEFVGKHCHSGQCPRKIIGAASGARLELCSCAHGETNAIIKAKSSVANCWMFCSCGVPCIECTKLIINSRLSAVFVVDPEDSSKDYSPNSRWVFEHSNTDLILVEAEML